MELQDLINERDWMREKDEMNIVLQDNETKKTNHYQTRNY